MPPTAVMVKPSPICHGVSRNSAKSSSSSDQPAGAGAFVLRMPERLDGQSLEAQLEDAGVLALVGVEVEEAAALDRLGVDRDADAVRRLEAEVHVDQAEVRLDAAGAQVEPHADPVDRQVNGPDGDVGARGELDARSGGRRRGLRPIAICALLDPERPELRDVRRHVRLEAARGRLDRPRSAGASGSPPRGRAGVAVEDDDFGPPSKRSPLRS